MDRCAYTASGRNGGLGRGCFYYTGVGVCCDEGHRSDDFGYQVG